MHRDPLAARVYGRLLFPPSLPMPGICDRCRNIISTEHMRCYRCAATPNSLHLMSPLSYAVGGGRLHTMLRGYKDDASVVTREHYTRSLASILDEYLNLHEA